MPKYMLFTTRVKNILTAIDGTSYHKLPPLRMYFRCDRSLEVNYCFPALRDDQVMALKLAEVLEPAGRWNDLPGVALAVPEADYDRFLDLITEYKRACDAERDPAYLDAIIAEFDRNVGEAREMLVEHRFDAAATGLQLACNALSGKVNRRWKLATDTKAAVQGLIAAHHHPVAP